MVLVRRGRRGLFEAEVADSLLKRAKGVMFSREFKPLLFLMPFTARHSFHSFFCPAFEVVFIDEKGVVVGVDFVKPSSFFSCVKEFAFVFELPVGFVEKFGLKEGDRLQW